MRRMCPTNSRGNMCILVVPWSSCIGGAQGGKRDFNTEIAETLHVLSKEPVAILSLPNKTEPTEPKSEDQDQHMEVRERDSGKRFKPIGVVEGDGVHHILVTFQGGELVTSHGIPHPACAVIASGDKPVPQSESTQKQSGVQTNVYVIYTRAALACPENRTCLPSC